MPQANDGALTRLVTTKTGATVEDTAPNQQSPGGPVATFDLHLEGVAGTALGDNTAQYLLTITAVDLTAGTGAPTSMNPNTTVAPNPANSNQQNFDAPTWTPVIVGGTTIEFVTNQTYTIPVPPKVNGHLFLYTASLVSTDFDEAWLIVGEPFVLETT
jgi:hypothetical protein